MESANLPTIDWDLGTRLAGNNRDIATDLLALLIKNLANDLQVITQHYLKHDFSNLCQEVHKLRGATSYCGLPKLQSLLTSLETDLKNHIMDSLASKMTQLEDEVRQILEHPTLAHAR